MSQQNSGTPIEFIRAVEKKFGVNFGFDIACTHEDNIVLRTHGEKLVPDYNCGYNHDQGINALEQDWSSIMAPVSWLNPPWKHVRPWSKKCSEGTERKIQEENGFCVFESGTHIFSLFPAGVGTSWFADYVLNQCAVYFLRPRLVYVDPRTGKPFVSAKTGKPQTGLNDAILCDWEGEPGTYAWKWR
jgi:hypothetical protein